MRHTPSYLLLNLFEISSSETRTRTTIKISPLLTTCGVLMVEAFLSDPPRPLVLGINVLVVSVVSNFTGHGWQGI